MLYSLRMRAELEGRHVSGAERIIKANEVEKTIKEFLRRPKLYDRMVITIEDVKEIEYIPKALPIYSYDFKSVEEAHRFAINMLMKEGVKEEDYTTGYVAGKTVGYVRIKPMKEEGVPIGGRVYFVKREDFENLVECLEKRVVLIEEL